QGPRPEHLRDEVERRRAYRGDRASRGEALDPGNARAGDFGGQANVEIDAEGPGDLLVEELSERPVRRVHAVDDLLHVEADRHRVVAVSRTGWPRGCLPRKQA